MLSCECVPTENRVSWGIGKFPLNLGTPAVQIKAYHSIIQTLSETYMDTFVYCVYASMDTCTQTENLSNDASMSHVYAHLYTDRKSQQRRLNVSINIIDAHTYPYTYACTYIFDIRDDVTLT